MPSVTTACAKSRPVNDAFTGSIGLTHAVEGGKPDKRLATIHVLVLWEDEEWCAIALELGIRSYGSTIARAYRTLTDARGGSGRVHDGTGRLGRDA